MFYPQRAGGCGDGIRYSGTVSYTHLTLTKREEELMEFLWQQGEPLAANEILDRCKERSWSDRYLQAMLRSLEKKGAIAVSYTHLALPPAP